MATVTVGAGNNTGLPDLSKLEVVVFADGGYGGFSAIFDPANTANCLKPAADGSLAVTSALSSQVDGHSVTIGAKADAAWDGLAANASLVAALKYTGAELALIYAALTNAAFESLVIESPQSSSTTAPSNSTVAAYATSKVVKAAPGQCFCVSGYNSAAFGQFIQLHDAAALPANGAVPVLPFWVPAQSNFSYEPGGKFGRYFATGIVVCNSSTGPTKTIGAADCWFDVQYK